MQNRSRSPSPCAHVAHAAPTRVFAVPKELTGMLSVFFFATLITFAASLALSSNFLFLCFLASFGCCAYFYVRVANAAKELAKYLSSRVDLSQFVLDSHVQAQLKRMRRLP